MAQLIGVIGAECTGKSTLAAVLREELDGLYVPESLREWVNARGRTPVASEQRAIMRAQVRAEDSALREAEQSGRPWVVGDPSPLMTAVYSVAYFGDRGLIEEGLRLLARNRLTVWCQPDFQWQPDGLHRDGPAVRTAVHDLIGEVLAGQQLPVLRVFGTMADRVAAVRTQLGD